MEIVLSGIQPTGRLHLGNLVGAVQNWVRIQEQYRCFYMIADLHSLTTLSGKVGHLKENILDLYMDLLACGIDQEKSVLFIQSAVPAHTQLHLILSMITPLGWLERNPTFKEKKQELKGQEVNNYGFLGYPVLQAADILIYKAHKVPVGFDQLPHLEITREIARKFNSTYSEYFPEPLPLLTPVSKILGSDGRKMSKSYDNAVYLSDPPETIEAKIRKFITDPKKIHKNDPGRPEICSIFTLYASFTGKDAQKETEQECRSGRLGCVECKKKIAQAINAFLAPYREKKEYYKNHVDFIYESVIMNNQKAGEIARKHMTEIFEIIGLNPEYGE